MLHLQADTIIVFSFCDIKEVWQALYQKGLGTLQLLLLHQFQQKNVWSIQNQFYSLLLIDYALFNEYSANFFFWAS